MQGRAARIRALFATRSMRGTLLIALASMTASGITQTVYHLRAKEELHREAHEAVKAQLTLLKHVRAVEGDAALADLVAFKSQVMLTQDFVYALKDKDGRQLAGSVIDWPVGPALDVHFNYTAKVASLGNRTVDAIVHPFQDGSLLLVGTMADETDSILLTFERDLAIAVVVTLVVALVFGWYFSRRALAFVDIFSESAQKLFRGDMSAQIAISPANDEFDRLARTINASAVEMQRMTMALRLSTDSMAHDLRTPLNRVRVGIELALRRREARGESTEGTVRALADVDRLLDHINGLLELSKTEAVTSAQFDDVRLDDIARDVHETYLPLAEEKNIALLIDAPSAPTRGVRKLLAQALANLVGNAVKFTPAGGSIGISCGLAGAISWMQVADSGPGIAPQDRLRAQERFVQLDESRSGEGVGLGLAMVNAIARVHGGRLALGDNDPGLVVRMTWEARS